MSAGSSRRINYTLLPSGPAPASRHEPEMAYNDEPKTVVELKTAVINRALEETGMGRYQWCMYVVSPLSLVAFIHICCADSVCVDSDTPWISCGHRRSVSLPHASSRSLVLPVCYTSSGREVKIVRTYANSYIIHPQIRIMETYFLVHLTLPYPNIN